MDVVGYLGHLVYEYHRHDLFSMLGLPQSAYFVSFENELRGIALNPDVPETSTGDGLKFLRSLRVNHRERRYFSVSCQKFFHGLQTIG